MIRKVSPLNAAFLGIRKPATKVSNNINKMFANANSLRKRKVWNLKQKLSSNFSQSFLCEVAEFKDKDKETKKYIKEAKKIYKQSLKNKPSGYKDSMIGWTRNGAAIGATTGGILGSPLGLAGTASGAATGGLYGGVLGNALGAYRNAARNIKKNYKDPKQRRVMRYARYGTIGGTFLGSPGIGSMLGAGIANTENNK